MRQLFGVAADVLYDHIAHCGDSGDGDGGISGRNHHWVCQEWRIFPVAVLDFFGAFAVAAGFGADRNHLVFCAPCEPFDPSGWQHDGGARRDKGFCSIRRHSRDSAIISACHYGHLRARGFGFIHPSLCVRDFDMRLPERRTSPPSLIFNNEPK